MPTHPRSHRSVSSSAVTLDCSWGLDVGHPEQLSHPLLVCCRLLLCLRWGRKDLGALATALWLHARSNIQTPTIAHTGNVGRRNFGRANITAVLSFLAGGGNRLRRVDDEQQGFSRLLVHVQGVVKNKCCSEALLEKIEDVTSDK
jgi:hypothetical protein